MATAQMELYVTKAQRAQLNTEPMKAPLATLAQCEVANGKCEM
jgi:hypothetical protein